MGRGKGGKKSRTQRKHFQESRENVWNSKRPRSDSDPIPFSNPFATQNLAFDHYYKAERQVIANDLDIQRCNLLIHQTKRMCTANLIVTNHEAQHFPGCLLEKHYDKMELDQEAQLLFDRVLCDVPCSGDGTLRKAPDLWRKWYVTKASGSSPAKMFPSFVEM
ncbi:hypothetical protein V8G54_018475 [Vigna mungo]|uniref:SAM-dependent MTase RsmB/NOP-type domain-containing protein n=1 Tax=Vigna mungo TaxID=3915 RepID=A0AAQ3N8G4_VIGMU